MNNIQQVLAIYWKLCDRNPQNRWFTLIIMFFFWIASERSKHNIFFTTRTSFCAWDHYPPVLGGVGWGKGDRCSGFPPPDRETRAGAHRRCRGRGRGDRGTTPRMRVGWRCRGGRAHRWMYAPTVVGRSHGGVPRALACAGVRTRSTASEPQRPPVSIATTMRHRLLWANSG